MFCEQNWFSLLLCCILCCLPVYRVDLTQFQRFNVIWVEHTQRLVSRALSSLAYYTPLMFTHGFAARCRPPAGRSPFGFPRHLTKACRERTSGTQGRWNTVTSRNLLFDVTHTLRLGCLWWYKWKKKLKWGLVKIRLRPFRLRVVSPTSSSLTS